MARRLIVKVNISRVENFIKNKGWSNSYFSEEIMGKPRGWLTEWKRGKNFPSPEEAARMCALLQATPEDILLKVGETEEETAKCQADIALVHSLFEQEREKHIENSPDPATGGSKDALLDFVRNTDDRAVLLAVLDEVNKKLQKLK